MHYAEVRPKEKFPSIPQNVAPLQHQNWYQNCVVSVCIIFKTLYLRKCVIVYLVAEFLPVVVQIESILPWLAVSKLWNRGVPSWTSFLHVQTSVNGLCFDTCTFTSFTCKSITNIFKHLSQNSLWPVKSTALHSKPLQPVALDDD